jgi:hypothetical protein
MTILPMTDLTLCTAVLWDLTVRTPPQDGLLVGLLFANNANINKCCTIIDESLIVIFQILLAFL